METTPASLYLFGPCVGQQRLDHVTALRMIYPIIRQNTLHARVAVDAMRSELPEVDVEDVV